MYTRKTHAWILRFTLHVGGTATTRIATGCVSLFLRLAAIRCEASPTSAYAAHACTRWGSWCVCGECGFNFLFRLRENNAQPCSLEIYARDEDRAFDCVNEAKSETQRISKRIIESHSSHYSDKSLGMRHRHKNTHAHITRTHKRNYSRSVGKCLISMRRSSSSVLLCYNQCSASLRKGQSHT